MSVMADPKKKFVSKRAGLVRVSSNKPDERKVNYHVDCKNRDYNDTMMDSMLDMQRWGEFTDFTLKLANGKAIKCHKMILAIACPFFRTALNSGLEESKTNEMDLTHLDSDVLKDVIQYFYTGNIVIKMDSIEHFISAASFLMLDELKHDCEQKMLPEVSEEKAALWFHFACLFDLKDIKKLCETKYFMKICFSAKFKALPCNELVRILQLNEVNVDSEDTVLQACIEWVLHDEEDRKVNFKNLAPHLRLHFCSEEFLEATMKKYKNILPPQLRTKHSRSKLAAKSAKKPRVQQSVEKVLLVCADFRCSRSWYLHSSGQWKEYDSGGWGKGIVCPVKNGFIHYINGILAVHDSIQHVSYQLGNLRTLLETETSISVSSCVNVDEKLYMFGHEWNSNNYQEKKAVLIAMEIEGKKAKVKIQSELLMKGKNSLCAVAEGSKIYVLGITLNEKSTLHCYDVGEDTWQELASNPSNNVYQERDQKGYHYDGKLFFVTSHGIHYCWTYNISTNEWNSQHSTDHNFGVANRHISHIALKDELLFIASLQSKSKAIDKKESLSLSTCEWKKSTQPVPKALSSCGNTLWVNMSLLKSYRTAQDDKNTYVEAGPPSEVRYKRGGYASDSSLDGPVFRWRRRSGSADGWTEDTDQDNSDDYEDYDDEDALW